MWMRLASPVLALVLAAGAFALAADPQEALTKISEIRKTRPATEEAYRSQEAEVKKVVDEALKGVDVKKIEAGKAEAYLSLLENTERYEDILCLVDRVLASKPKTEPQSGILITGINASMGLTDLKKAEGYASRLPAGTDAEKVDKAGIYVGYLDENLAVVKGAGPAIKMYQDFLASLPAATQPPARGESIRAQIYVIIGSIYESNKDHAAALKTLDEGIEALKTSRFVSGIKAKKTQLNLIGSTAPSIAAEKTIGAYTSLESLRGKVVVIDFFAHWCGPCKASFPEMIELYSELKDKGVEVVQVTSWYGFYGKEKGLTPDQEFEKMQGFVKEYKLPWTVVFSDKSVFGSYGVSGIPDVVVVDPQGRINEIKIGYDPATFQAFKKRVKDLAAKAATVKS